MKNPQCPNNYRLKLRWENHWTQDEWLAYDDSVAFDDPLCRTLVGDVHYYPQVDIYTWGVRFLSKYRQLYYHHGNADTLAAAQQAVERLRHITILEALDSKRLKVTYTQARLF